MYSYKAGTIIGAIKDYNEDKLCFLLKKQKDDSFSPPFLTALPKVNTITADAEFLDTENGKVMIVTNPQYIIPSHYTIAVGDNELKCAYLDGNNETKEAKQLKDLLIDLDNAMKEVFDYDNERED